MLDADQRDLVIEAADIYFEPKEFDIAPGDTITMTNFGMLEHDFAVDDWGGVIIGPLSDGESGEFTIPSDAKPGETYTFYCSIPGHKESGMVGTLTITEGAASNGDVAAGTDAEESVEDEDTAAAEATATVEDLVAFNAGEQPSGPGGTGNTREDVYDYWSLDANSRPTGEFTEEGFHYVGFDLPDYQISFIFMLDGDNQPRQSDRAVDIVVSFIDSVARPEALRLAQEWIPDDVTSSGASEMNVVGDVIQEYRSDMIAEGIPNIDYPGFKKPGGVWVTLWPADGQVGVIEISLFHPRSEEQ